MRVYILLLLIPVALGTIQEGTETELETYDTIADNTNCSFIIWNQSKTYYESRLVALKPNFMHFTLKLEPDQAYNTTPGVFRPLHWVWTYTSPTASYPYLAWNIDHGLLSFGLLDVKTAIIPYVQIKVEDNCTVTFGSEGTTWSIVKALKDLIINMRDQSYHKYEQSYFCYLAEAPGIRQTTEYYAALYLNYPIAFLNYNCCVLRYSYVFEKYQEDCKHEQHDKWIQCTLGPYILGIIIFMYFPIPLLEFCAWLSKDEKVLRQDVELINKTWEEYEELNRDDNEWVYLDGKAPITLLGSLNVLFCGLNRKHPILVSRIRRLICISLAPSVIFIQLKMYAGGIGIENSKVTVPELVKVGTPMGFLSLLADREDRVKFFAPLLGGPVCLLIMYYVLAIVFLIIPRSLKQIVERGMPHSDISSPLFLNVDEIIRLSMVPVTPEPGYENGAAVCRCGVYMIFNTKFWLRVIEMQKGRFHLNESNESKLICCFRHVAFPFYLMLCSIEIILCIILYGIPVIGFVQIMVKGAAKSFFMFRLQNTYVSMIFRNTLSVFVGTMVVLALFLFFVYDICLIFVQSFSFISQIVIFCFVAVIVYPSVAFGYLFFFVVMVYYVVRLVKDFGDSYLELLSIAVEKSQDMYSQINHLSIFDDQLLLSNVQVNQIRGIRVNDMRLDIPQNVLQRLGKNDCMKKIAEKDNIFGIPKRLFDCLVQRHRPIHIQVIKILFQLIFVVCLVTITMSITSKFATGATSEISEVMHVIFIVTVGALPRVLEVALMNSSETVKRDIEIRRIEQTINEFWLLEADDGFTFEQ